MRYLVISFGVPIGERIGVYLTGFYGSRWGLLLEQQLDRHEQERRMEGSRPSFPPISDKQEIQATGMVPILEHLEEDLAANDPEAIVILF